MNDLDLSELEQTLRRGDEAELAKRLSALHPAQVADLMEALPPDARMSLWRATDPARRGQLLVETHAEVKAQLVAEADAGQLVAALDQLEADELADLDRLLPEDVLEAALARMDEDRRERYRLVHAYPDDSAGGLMDVDAISVRPDVPLAAVGRYMRWLRRRRGALPEHTESVMVVDRDERYLGTLQLVDLVSLPPQMHVGDALAHVPALPASAPASEVAHLFQDRDLMSAAVVDDAGRLLGRITVDDVLDVVQIEGERALLRPAGMDEEVDVMAAPAASARRRGVWLAVNLVNALVAAWVIGRFEASIAEVVALAVLMPVVASMGGVAGTQTLTLITRGLALTQVRAGNVRRVLAKETLVGLINGSGIAVVVSLIALLWFGNPVLAAVFGAAVFINLLNAAISGTLVPLALNRAGIDPALAGGVVLTALTDVIGFFSFLGLATLLLL